MPYPAPDIDEETPLLAGLSPREFLRTHWQKRPLLMPGALADWNCPIDSDDLGGLALEPLAESRLIFGEGPTASAYSLRHGPFEEQDLTTLPDRGWTLLVQGVETWSAAIAELMHPYRFLPDWRLDDVMVSAAAPGGGVGPHVDAYDVFLVQGCGSRRWILGGPVGPDAPIADHPDLRLLAAFDAQEDYVLTAGDVLYVPPGWAHWGIGEDAECLTLSVGFRAPSLADGLAGLATEIIGGDRPLSDPDRNPTGTPGRLAPEDLDRLAETLAQAVEDREALVGWIGRWSTRPKREDLLEDLGEILTGEALAVARDQGLLVAPGHRIVYFDGAQDDNSGPLRFFLDGDEILVPKDAEGIARILANDRFLPPELVTETLASPEAAAFLAEVGGRFALELPDDDQDQEE